MLKGYLEPFKDMEPVEGLVQLKGRPFRYYLLTEIDELLYYFPEVQKPWLIVDDGEENDAEGGLQLGMLIELVQDGHGNFTLFQLNDDPHAFPVGFVADRGNALDLFFFDQLNNVLDEAGFVDLIGDLGDMIASRPSFLYCSMEARARRMIWPLPVS